MVVRVQAAMSRSSDARRVLKPEQRRTAPPAVKKLISSALLKGNMKPDVFSNIVESLRQYRRADLSGFEQYVANPIEQLYVDPLPGDAFCKRPFRRIPHT